MSGNIGVDEFFSSWYVQVFADADFFERKGGTPTDVINMGPMLRHQMYQSQLRQIGI